MSIPRYPGYGIAVRWGWSFSVAIGSYCDADGSETPRILLRFIERLKKASIVPLVPGSPRTEVVDYPRLKLFLNRWQQVDRIVTQVKYDDFKMDLIDRRIIDSIKPLFAETSNYHRNVLALLQ